MSYLLIFRTREVHQRWHTIGRHGSPWTPETARTEAQRLLGLVVGGGDPASTKKAVRRAATVAELCDLYLKDAEAGRLLTRRKSAKKASTLLIDRGRIERHIKPLIGSIKLTAITSEDVDNFMHDVATGKTAGKTKQPENEVSQECGAERVQPAAPSVCSGESSHTRGCDQITRFTV